MLKPAFKCPYCGEISTPVCEFGSAKGSFPIEYEKSYLDGELIVNDESNIVDIDE